MSQTAHPRRLILLAAFVLIGYFTLQLLAGGGAVAPAFDKQGPDGVEVDQPVMSSARERVSDSQRVGVVEGRQAAKPGGLRLEDYDSQLPLASVSCTIVSGGVAVQSATDSAGVLMTDHLAVEEQRGGLLVPGYCIGLWSEAEGGVLRMRRQPIVTGLVISGEGIVLDDLRVETEAAMSPGVLALAQPSLAVDSSGRFRFRPQLWLSHILRVYTKVDSAGSVPLGVATWSPGDTVVSIVVHANVAERSDVTVEVSVPATWLEAMQQKVEWAQKSGRNLMDRHDYIQVYAIEDESGTEMQLGSAKAEDVTCVSRSNIVVGMYWFRVACTGLSVSRVCGPYYLRGPVDMVRVSVPEGGQLQVVVEGFDEVDLVTNPVYVAVMNVAGQRQATLYLDDRLVQKGIVSTSVLSAGKVSVWAFGKKKAARPAMVDIPNSGMASVACSLVTSVRVDVSVDHVSEYLTSLWLVDPLTGASSQMLWNASNGRASIAVAPGSWKIVAKLKEKVLEVPFQALGERVSVQVL